ncbi:Kv channel-interacting protein 1-like isoform X1 [Aphelenchoides fujianensis]|nr:Kv channel-interacting protein 1-like isoform X1 [Aphelenchoides fujianensis]
MAIPIVDDPNSHIAAKWSVVDEVDFSVLPCYRPQSLEDIIEKTRFTKREVKLIYRSFKQEIYSQFFPHSNARKYSDLVFNTLDVSGDGHVNFEEFIKLEWIFNLYDVNKRNFITQAEVLFVIQSMYDLLSRQEHNPATKSEIAMHAHHVFFRLTDNGKNKNISRRQFIRACMQDEELLSQFAGFDTKL